MANKFDFDVDIDMGDRAQFLDLVKHTPASIVKDGLHTKHNTGVYFQNIPKYPVEGYSTVDHKEAEQDGWFKVDFLNNHIYKDIDNEAHLDKLMTQEPLWQLLEHEEFVSQLFHIKKYTNILQQYKPCTAEQLAMILAIIRPGKKHLQGLPFEEIEKTVWDKPADDSYYFKKSHAIAYALTIMVQMNLICEKVAEPTKPF